MLYKMIFLVGLVLASVVPEKALPAASMWDDVARKTALTRYEKESSFMRDCAALAYKNTEIPEHQKGDRTLRIATYNIHYWTDPHEKENTATIFGVIKALNADVLILQEVRSTKKGYAALQERFKALGYRYGSDFFGNTLARSSTLLFGNLILSKIRFAEEPTIKTFARNYNTMELRCFIKAAFKLPCGESLLVYGTHLDVFDSSEKVRLAQINELLCAAADDKSKHVLIAGDFNAVRESDYSEVIDKQKLWDLVVAENAKRTVPTPTLVSTALKTARFTDCFTAANVAAPSWTAWAGTAVDFMMLKSGWGLPIKNCSRYFDAASDHVPLVLDIVV